MTALSPFRLCLLAVLAVLLAGTARGADQVVVFASQATISEDDNSVITFEVLRLFNTVGTLDVNFTVSGTATKGTDYVVSAPTMGTSPSGVLTIQNGANSGSITLTITNDNFAEVSEAITVTINPDSAGNTLYTATTNNTDSIVIIDDEPVLQIATGIVASEPATSGTFTVSYPGTARTSAVPFTYVISGSAIAGVDYVALTGNGSIPDNLNTVDISVTIINDSLADDGKILTVSLTSSAGYLIKPGSGIASMILGNDDTGVTAVSSTSPNGTYALGATVILTVTFNYPVAVTGAPTLALATGSSPALAQYLAGNGTSTLSFAYTVGPTDSSADLDCTGTTALTLNGGTIVKPSTTTPAVLTLPVPGQPGSLGANRNLVVNGITGGQKPVPGSVQSTDSSSSGCGLGQGIAALALMLTGTLLSLRRR